MSEENKKSTLDDIYDVMPASSKVLVKIAEHILSKIIRIFTPVPPPEISGFVKDSIGNDVADVIVTIGGKKDTTARDGGFIILNPSLGVQAFDLEYRGHVFPNVKRLHIKRGLQAELVLTLPDATNPPGDKQPQIISSITVDTSNLLVGGIAAIRATGGTSGNPVTFKTLTPNVCTISDNTVTAIAAGYCVIAADQAGNDKYESAHQVTQGITIREVPPRDPFELFITELATFVHINANGDIDMTEPQKIKATILGSPQNLGAAFLVVQSLDEIKQDLMEQFLENLKNKLKEKSYHLIWDRELVEARR